METNYLIDSDVVISHLKGVEPGAIWMEELKGEKLSICVVTWWEVMYGIRKFRARKKLRIFKSFLDDYRISVVSISRPVADKFIDLKLELESKGERLADFDLLIASTALVSKSVLGTGNVKHFKRIKGLKIYKES
jgi:predicted nucleic acid-binding protein